MGRFKHTATLLGAAAAALTLSSCNMMADVTTMQPYAPSDGVRVDVGNGVVVENLLFVTGPEGGEAAVHGLVRNDSLEPMTVTISLTEGGDFEFSHDLEPGTSYNFSVEEDLVATIDAVPGESIPARVEADGAIGDVKATIVSTEAAGYEEAGPGSGSED